MKSIIIGIKNFNWRLWLSLAVSLLIPALYTTLRVYFLGSLPGEWGVNIASQLSWVSLLYEIFEEAFILPLYYIFGKSFSSKNELEIKTKTIITIAGSVYLILSLLIIIFAKPLCIFMATDMSTLAETAVYIRLESIGMFVGIIYKVLFTLFITIGKDKYIYSLLIIQTTLSVLFDSLFLSKLPISLNLGVNGVAYCNIIVNTILTITAYNLLIKENVNLLSKGKLSSSWIKEYLTVGLFSGLESFVRNIAFIIMVSRMVNVINEQGTYWIANNFIWTWLLLPSTAMYDVIKKETAENINNIKTKTPGYICVSALFSILWFASIPLWKPFIRNILNVTEYKTVYYITIIQSIFYIVYIFNCIFDGTIYGRGKTKYMLIESLFTNTLFYGIMFVLYIKGIWVPSLTSISLMFGFGMVVDLIPTVCCYLFLIKSIKNV